VPFIDFNEVYLPGHQQKHRQTDKHIKHYYYPQTQKYRQKGKLNRHTKKKML